MTWVVGGSSDIGDDEKDRGPELGDGERWDDK